MVCLVRHFRASPGDEVKRAKKTGTDPEFERTRHIGHIMIPK